jgi:hypothetical protein
MTNNTPTLAQLKRALEIAERIARLQSEMNSIFGGSAPSSSLSAASPGRRKGRRRKLLPQAVANIRAAQAKRWAKVKGRKAAAKPAKAKPAKRRGLTAAGRARLAAAMKKRWAAARKSGGPLPTAKK